MLGIGAGVAWSSSTLLFSINDSMFEMSHLLCWCCCLDLVGGDGDEDEEELDDTDA